MNHCFTKTMIFNQTQLFHVYTNLFKKVAIMDIIFYALATNAALAVQHHPL